MLNVGTAAPDFALPDQDGRVHRLSELRGSWVVLYFYPKDDTPGCTKEACAFRDSLPRFGELDAVVLGVSADDQASHKEFATKQDRKSTRLNSSHVKISYAVFCLKKKRLLLK